MLVFRRDFPLIERMAMKRKQYPVEQIVAALEQAGRGMPVGDLIRQLGISEQTYYRWKKQYAGLESNRVRELTQLQNENARLKKPALHGQTNKQYLPHGFPHIWSTGISG